jgi:nitroreductase
MYNAATIIRNRRSHFPREFSGDILSDLLVWQLLELAHQAPSHKLTYPWRFAVFSGAAKNKLVDAMGQYYDTTTPPEQYSTVKRDKIAGYSRQVSHILGIGICFSGKVPQWEEIAATAMAVQNIYIALSEEQHAAGYWSTGNGTGSETMRGLCGWDESVQHFGWFMLGHVETKRHNAGRPPVTDFVSRPGGGD